jgi:arginine-tRNA-protein transferase
MHPAGELAKIDLICSAGYYFWYLLFGLMHYFISLREPLAPHIMDAALAQGYYRMRQNLFTTDVTHTDDGSEVSVLWARVLLDDFAPNHRQRKLARLNRRFACTLHDAAITAEIEALYTSYRRAIDFNASESVAASMLDEREVNYFPGRMWQLRDGGRLIAVGYFDEGHESAAGILNFYDPDYRKYSPGLWLYLESVRYAAERGKRFFYPGYIALDYAKFDYKLLAGAARMELWDMNSARWIPYADSVHAEHARLVR